MKALGKLATAKFMKGLSPGQLIGPGMTAGFGIMEYKSQREQGNGVVGSASKAVAEAVMFDIVGGPAYFGAMAATGALKAAPKAIEAYTRQKRNMAMQGRNTPFANAQFRDSQQAYTMRQAGMAMANASKHNAQQAMLGNEAQFMHM